MVPLLIHLLVFELLVRWQMVCLLLQHFDIEISLLLPCLRGNSPVLEKQATKEES